MWKTTISMLGVLVLGSISARAVDTPAELQESFSLEARLLDDTISDYGRARSTENHSIAELRRLSDDLDKALEDPNVSLSYLRGLEDELGRGRDDACSLAANTAATREAMYDQMQRLGEVARRFEQATGEFGTTEAAIDGSWQIEAQPIEVFGLMNLKLKGAQLSGPYRLSNGNQGSVSGTLAGLEVRLQIIDSETGVLGTITGELDIVAGEIRGTWQALELAAGRPSSGDWTARRVSSAHKANLDY